MTPLELADAILLEAARRRALRGQDAADTYLRTRIAGLITQTPHASPERALCTLCGQPIYPGAAVHRDHAGAVMHSDCRYGDNP